MIAAAKASRLVAARLDMEGTNRSNPINLASLHLVKQEIHPCSMVTLSCCSTASKEHLGKYMLNLHVDNLAPNFAESYQETC